MGVTHMLFMGLANIVPVRAARHFHEGGKKALSDYLKRVTLLGEAATGAVAAIAAIAPGFSGSALFSAISTSGMGTFCNGGPSLTLWLF